MKKFIFIRHGLSTSNRDKIISGNLDVPLSEEGIVLLQEFKEKNFYPETDAYVSSTLSRCLDTFRIIADNKKLDIKSDFFREISFGDIQGTSPKEGFLDNYFVRLFANELISGNELYSDFVARLNNGIMETYKFLESNNLNSVTVICHSTVIKSIVHEINNIPKDHLQNIKIRNGQGISVNVKIEDNKINYYNLEELKI